MRSGLDPPLRRHVCDADMLIVLRGPDSSGIPHAVTGRPPRMPLLRMVQDSHQHMLQCGTQHLAHDTSWQHLRSCYARVTSMTQTVFAHAVLPPMLSWAMPWPCLPVLLLQVLPITY